MKPWEYIDAMTIKKLDLDMSDSDVGSNYSPYMINKWLSQIDIFIEIIYQLSMTTNLSKQQHYNFLKDVLPNYNITGGIDFKLFKKYKNIEKKNKEIRYIATYYEVGLVDAKMYYKMLSKENIENIINTFRYGANNILEV